MSGPAESMLVVDKYMMHVQVTYNMMEDNMLQDTEIRNCVLLPQTHITRGSILEVKCCPM